MLRERVFQPPFRIGKQRFRQFLRIIPSPSDSFLRPIEPTAQYITGEDAGNKVNGLPSGGVYNLELGIRVESDKPIDLDL
jgi:hypothetical protein